MQKFTTAIVKYLNLFLAASTEDKVARGALKRAEGDSAGVGSGCGGRGGGHPVQKELALPGSTAGSLIC